MDIDRAVLTRALTTGGISTMLARGIEPRHFAPTTSGREASEVYEWATAYARRYNVSPSQPLVKERFPNWRGEPSSDPLDALIDAFIAQIKRRTFQSKLLELAPLANDPSRFDSLDEAMLDAARDLCSVVPGSQVQRLSEMHQRIDAYERDAQEETRPGIALGIPAFDEVIYGGIKPGNVVTIAGYLNLGKSLLASWLSLNFVEQDRTGLFLPLEMSASEVLERVDTMITNFSYKLLATRKLPERDLALWRRMAIQYNGVHSNLIIPERIAACTIDRVYAEINRYRPDFTVIDYVQLMRRPNPRFQKWEGIDEITNEMKAIARATDSVIIMVSQDNRDAAQNGSTLSNMSGHVSVGQAPDLYIGLEQTPDMRTQQQMRVKLLKSRRGPRDLSCDLIWQPSTMTFRPPKEGDEARSFLKAVA